MKYKIILLTGIPSSGKTYLSKQIEKKFQPFLRIGFGSLIAEVRENKGIGTEYSNLRASPLTFANRQLVEEARSLLELKIRQSITENNIVIDSHAVVNDRFGFRVIPELFDEIKVSGVIALNPDISVIEQRQRKEPDGRPPLEISQLLQQIQLQNSVVTTYSLLQGCPAYYLDIKSNEDDLMSNIKAIFDDLSIEYNLVSNV